MLEFNDPQSTRQTWGGGGGGGGGGREGSSVILTSSNWNMFVFD